MRKIIAAGQCRFITEFQDGVPNRAYPGDCILNAAAQLGNSGYPIEFVGECGTDRIGDEIISFLESNNVSTRSIDRYTEGLTPVTFTFNDAESTRYEKFPEQEFDFVWPSVSEHDIVVFGSYFAVSPRARKKLYEFLEYAAERGAIIIYLPDITQKEIPNITRHKPSILENLEISDIIVSNSCELPHIFGNNNDSNVYSGNISFYCDNFINIDWTKGQINHYNKNNLVTVPLDLDKESDVDKMQYSSQIASNIIRQIISGNIYRKTLSEFKFKI